MNLRFLTLILSFLIFRPASGQVSTNSFFNWETAPVHPVALSPDKSKLAVCNLPDNRVELFNITSGHPVPLGSISVGLDPVSACFKDNSELWVANFISDSVSVVDVATMTVARTIPTLNEPSDIQFAGSPTVAFVTCAQPNTVQVFDATTSTLRTNLTIQGNRPRSMASSPDGTKMYVAVFESGNASTIIGSGVTDPNAAIPASPVDFPDSPSQGLNPPPNSGTNFVPGINPLLTTNTPPRVSVIVKRNASGAWVDDNNKNWSSYVSGTNAVFTGRAVGWDLADHDLAVIDTSTFSISYVNGLMNICMDVAVNPATGKPTVIGTDAMNQIRFEPNLKGTFLRVNAAVVDPLSRTSTILDLNPHLTYSSPTTSNSERDKSIGDPRGIIWNTAGTRAYVTGMGSDNLIILDAQGRRSGLNVSIPLPSGPSGLALDDTRQRLFVLNRFAGSISVIDTATESIIETVPLFDPTPSVIKNGRSHLYDTHKSSGLGQASCGSCHVDARFDRLAWDLGNPAGEMTIITSNKFNFARFPPSATNNFHPMKGPMVTQTLQDIINHEPFHWRGDREGLEQFNQTFTNLQAATSALTTNELQNFKEFLGTIRFAPNPFRQFDNTLSTNVSLAGHTSLGRGASKSGTTLPNGNAQTGMTQFRLQGASGCIHCHSLPTGLGPDLSWTGTQWKSISAGTNGEHHSALIALARSNFLPLKIPHLRNLYEKAGTDYTKTNSLAGFGFLHDGSVDTLTRFIQDGFAFRDDQQTADMIAFMLSFTGSDLPAGSTTDPDRPPGSPSNDTPAAVGRQMTITNSNSVAFITSMLTLASNSTSRVELVVKGLQGGIGRGWFFDRTTGRFLSDRKGETILPDSLRNLASPTNALTYTMVPAGCGRRIGLDRDEDGYFDRDELDFGSDPANALSLATNTPPLLSAITNLTVPLGQTISFTATATDNDLPAQQLFFSLATNAPTGATINSSNGLFVWTPGASQAPSTNPITIKVTDSGTPNLTASQSFAVVVTLPDLRMSQVEFTTNGLLLNWTAIPGRNYRVQYKTNLNDPSWVDLSGEITAEGSSASTVDPTLNADRERYYRITLLP